MKITQMITSAGDGRVPVLMAALAFFNFVFLGTEYLFDNRMALVSAPAQVVTAQGYILGASVLGFVFYPAVVSILERKRERAVVDLHRIQETSRMVSVFAGALAGIICIFVIWQHPSYTMMMIAGSFCFILLGMGGSAVHYELSLAAEERHLAKTVGISYAAGICLQFLNHHLVKHDMAESIVLAVSAAVFAVLLLRTEMTTHRIEKCVESTKAPAHHSDLCEMEGHQIRKKYSTTTNDEVGQNLDICRESSMRACFWLALLVILLTCIFSTLDAAVTLVHAAGSADVGAWPRLLLAGSGLLAGILFDGWKQRFSNILMYCVTILSVLSIVVLDNGGAFSMGLVVFYVSAGFFVVFFTTAFMRLSVITRCPRLWAGFGRAINNLCAFFMGPVSIQLLQSKDQILRAGVLLGLLAMISLAFFGYVHAMQSEQQAPEMGEEQRQLPDEAEQLQLFAQQFSLTTREKEVLQVLLVSEENVQDIAEELLISRAALYRHIASLNEKTGTKSRIGLVQFYYRYQGRTENEKETLR